MNNSYERFAKILNDKGITPYRVHKDTGIATATLSDWKNGKSTPKQDKLKKIAEYFGVTVDYLMTGEDSHFDKFSEENAYLVGKIRNDTELNKALLKYFALSDVKKKHIVELINLLSEVQM